MNRGVALVADALKATGITKLLHYSSISQSLNLEICHHFSDFYSLKIHIRQMQLRGTTMVIFNTA